MVENKKKYEANELMGTLYCKNCNHAILLTNKCRVMHFTQFYHDHGFPHNTQKCYFPINNIYCNCTNPELKEKDKENGESIET